MHIWPDFLHISWSLENNHLMPTIGRFWWTKFVLQDVLSCSLSTSAFGAYHRYSRHGNNRFEFFLTTSWITTFNKHVSTSSKAMNRMERVLKISGWSFQNQVQVIFIRQLEEEEAMHFKFVYQGVFTKLICTS